MTEAYNTGPFSETNNIDLIHIFVFLENNYNYSYIMSELCNLISFDCHKEKGNNIPENNTLDQ